MKIKAEDIVAMLKKMDEVEGLAARSYSSCDAEDLQRAVEKMRQLRAMLYSMLAAEQEEPAFYPLAYPVVVPAREKPWWEQVTCIASGTSGNN